MRTAEEQADIFGLVNEMMRCFPSQMFDEIKSDIHVQALSERYQKFCTEKSLAFATFAVWQSCIEIVDLLLQFVSCTRNSDWASHQQTLTSPTPWLFAYDRVNYLRYVPIYLKEMKDLQQTHPFAHKYLENLQFKNKTNTHFLPPRLIK